MPYADSPIKAYQHHAYSLGALFTLGEAAYPCFYSNYIALTTGNGIDFQRFRNNHLPVFEKHDYLLDALTASGANVNVLLKYLIDSEYYIEIQADEFYVPNRRSYNRNHFIHNLLIIGFDDTERIFNTVGYTSSMHLEETDITYQESWN